MWVQPTDEELFERYNPELQKRSLEGRYERQKEFDDFVTKLKEYSKSDKPSERPLQPPPSLVALFRRQHDYVHVPACDRFFADD